jgi:hypothetical protein
VSRYSFGHALGDRITPLAENSDTGTTETPRR